jgi:hypothetical protein
MLAVAFMLFLTIVIPCKVSAVVALTWELP